MKKIFFFCMILLNSTFCFSQSGWFQVNTVIPNLQLLNIQFTSVSTGYAVGYYSGTYKGDILKTTNEGLNWQRTAFDSVSLSDIYFLDNNTGYLVADIAGSALGYIYKTVNGGANWNLIFTNFSNGFFKIKFYDYNTGFVAGKYNQVFKTTNGGLNWESKTGATLHEPTAIWCFDSNNWIITDNLGDFNRTTNGGNNWIYHNFYTTNINLASIYFFNITTGIEVSYYGGIYKTTNSGSNWFKIDSVSSNLYGITFINNNTGYVTGAGNGTSGSIFKTTNGGNNWLNQAVPGISYLGAITFINDLTGYVIDYEGPKIFKTTTGGAVFVNNISTEIPSEYKLNQNYPNPFNPKTKIEFELRNSGFIKIEIYNSLGMLIETIVKEKLNAGSYETEWDASNYPSGVYFYRLSVNEFTETKKMLLIK
jgi:photosystem II stability/assembly factor-like uncharacterized protein